MFKRQVGIAIEVDHELGRVGKQRRTSERSSWFLRYFLVIASVSLLPLGFWSMSDESWRAAMILSGVLCLLAIGFPFFARGSKLNPLEPIVLGAFAVAIGCALRSIYIGFSGYYRADFLTFGQSFAEIANGGLWVAAALACLSGGYLLTSARVRLERFRLISKREVRLDGRFWFASLIGIILAVVSTYIFANLFDVGLSSETISRKRHLDLGGEETTSALGPVRILAGFAECSLYVLVAHKMFRKERWGASHAAVGVMLFSVSAVVPFITSSRASLGIILINCLALVYLAGRLRLRLLIVSALVIMFMIAVMGNLRSGGRDSEAGGTAVDAIVGSGNFVDLARTTAIVDRVPEYVPYQNGRTYASLVTAPIPSSVWPGKPPLSLGPWVKAKIFEQRTVSGGWPPGVLGEAAMNFGIPGMLGIGFLFGSLLRFVYNSFEPLLRNNINAAVIYVTIFWPLGLQLIGSSFAHGTMRTIQALVPALIILVFVSRNRSLG